MRRIVPLLLVLAAPLLAQGRVTPRDIQNAEQQAKLLYREGRYVEAADLETKIYNSCRQVYGVNHLQTGAAAFRLGGLHSTIGNYDRVEPLLVEALQIFRAQGVRDDPNVAAVLNALGTLYSRLGQVRKAEHAWNKALEILIARRAMQAHL
jgi:tetratricopeptide (TPR) repeat protein